MHDIAEAELWAFKRTDQPVRIKRSPDIRKDPGHLVPAFLNLARKVTTLTFLNLEHVLLFRGQGCDRRNQTSLSRCASPRPGKATVADGSFAGLLKVSSARAQTIRITSTEAAWLDVISSDKLQRRCFRADRAAKLTRPIDHGT